VKQVLLAVFLGSWFPAVGQTDIITFDDVAQSVQDWARENIDDDVLRVLEGADQDRVRHVLQEIQKEFHGEHVADLASLKDAVQAILPILEAHEETLPYAKWLKTRLDYLETASELRLVVPPPATEPGKPRPPPPNPAPGQEREIWARKLAARPWPENAKSLVEKLKPIFAAEKVPPELVWVAEVESSFDPGALSPAGAAGLFQLMPATAKRYGLRTWPFDQRLSVEKNGRAAARYLAILHRKFKEWRLVLAAYNAGEGVVDGLLKRHQASSYDAIATFLPAETQMYVPKVEAAILSREGVNLNELP
jgi:membrane-bound lytic murein transglycosylase D